MNPGLFEQGLNLMLIGMGTVFVFLTLLVGATTLMSRLAARLAPVAADAVAEGDVEPAVVAAIGAAIAQHRRR